MSKQALIESNFIWSLICRYNGAIAFRETTLIDFPIRGVEVDDVHAINSACDGEDGEMYFHIAFKDDNREALRLYFGHASTLNRLRIFMSKRLQKITWDKGAEDE